MSRDSGLDRFATAAGGADAPGSSRIITFYSYKGGTGRSMALANVAVLLAQRNVPAAATLMIDFDLEAPGLHKYFPLRADDGQMADAKRPGLIDLFCLLDELSAGWESLSFDHRAAKTREAVAAINLDEYITQTSVEHLYLLKAGRFDPTYAALVNNFRWNEFHGRVPTAVRMLVEALSNRYRQVLVDSRTGISDTSDICTMLLPEKLVVVFTPNSQSLDGVSDLISRAVAYRDASDDIRPFVIYPLPSRIETTEPTEQDAWRLGDARRGLRGWQPTFEQTIASAYGLEQCRLGDYFDEVQIQHQGSYAYGEKIAVSLERGTEIASLPKRYERFVGWLLDRSSPWEDPALASAAIRRRRALEQGNSAERVYIGLASADERDVAERLFLRLVRLLGDKEVGKYARRVAVYSDFANSPSLVVRVTLAFAEAQVLTLLTGKAGRGEMPLSSDTRSEPENGIQIADDLLLDGWPRLTGWIATHREFLIWRQRLEAQLEAWSAHREDQDLLLRADALKEASRWRDEEPSNLSPAELRFIKESEFQHNRMKASQQVAEAASTGAARRASAPWRSKTAYFLAAGATIGLIGLFAQLSPRKSVPGHIGLVGQLVASGDQAAAAGDESAAVAQYDSAIRLDSTYAPAFVGRGRLYGGRRAYDLANEDFTRAIALDSTSDEAYYQRGQVLLQLKQNNSATQDFVRAVRLRPNNTAALMSLGSALQATGQTDSALRVYGSAIRIDSGLALAYNRRAQLYLTRLDTAKARADFSRAVALSSTTDSVHVQSSQRLLALGSGRTTTTNSTNPHVTLQYADSTDGRAVFGVYLSLARRGSWRVDAPTRVAVSDSNPAVGYNSVRYYYWEDSTLAKNVREAVQNALGPKGTTFPLRVSHMKEGLFKGTKRGTIEVWILSLPRTLAK